jgi:tRNA 2-(methylsulfanyl)-N6-isopentenyladenosine37 hydroxylase
MLGLKLTTDPRWVNIVETNIEEILTDHAWCEQKAASNAIGIIVNNPEKKELVQAMFRIVNEEMLHFEQVHDIIVKRGLSFGRERKDDYVNELYKFMIRGGGNRDVCFVDRMLFSAMIEARSCERFKVLSENISDPVLAKFYRDLMESEAGHYTTFIGFARTYANGVDVDARWKEWLVYEATVIANYGKSERMHG